MLTAIGVAKASFGEAGTVARWAGNTYLTLKGSSVSGDTKKFTDLLSLIASLRYKPTGVPNQVTDKRRSILKGMVENGFIYDLYSLVTSIIAMESGHLRKPEKTQQYEGIAILKAFDKLKVPIKHANDPSADEPKFSDEADLALDLFQREAGI